MPLRVEPRPVAEALASSSTRRRLLSSGDYPSIKELAAPRTYDFPSTAWTWGR